MEDEGRSGELKKQNKNMADEQYLKLMFLRNMKKKSEKNKVNEIINAEDYSWLLIQHAVASGKCLMFFRMTVILKALPIQ